jgi:hypothetical protein
MRVARALGLGLSRRLQVVQEVRYHTLVDECHGFTGHAFIIAHAAAWHKGEVWLVPQADTLVQKLLSQLPHQGRRPLQHQLAVEPRHQRRQQRRRHPLRREHRLDDPVGR